MATFQETYVSEGARQSLEAERQQFIADSPKRIAERTRQLYFEATGKFPPEDPPANVAQGQATNVSRTQQPTTSEAPVTSAAAPDVPRATVDPYEVDNGAGTRDTVSKDNYVVTTFPNPLEQFASYSVLWTLACLTRSQFNDPSSYRGKEGALKNIVFSSGGRYDKDRANTAFGVPEFYINNFVMKNIIAANQKTGNSNAVKFEWDIYEPYSMGLLLQSLQVAARQSGFISYLDNAPFVLKMDIRGFGENQEIISSIKSKYFVMKITKAQFQVTESGSVYKMEAIPYNHLGFSDEINTMYNDLKLVAGNKGTVEELLSTGTESLQSALNKIEEDLVLDEKILVPDEYRIVFPKNSNDFVRLGQEKQNLEEKRATQDPNSSNERKVAETRSATRIIEEFEQNNIGKADFGLNQSNGGNYTFRRPGFQVDEKTGIVKRDNLTINPKDRSFQFAQGQTITAIINQIILSSSYARDGLTPDSDGFITWWKVDIQIELLDFDNWTGDFARRFTFRVVPYRIHHTVFSNPNSAPIGYEQLAKNIVKAYNYIYTGKNVDVLKLDININNLFYTGANPSDESTTAQTSNPDQQGTTEKTNASAKTGVGPADTAKAANFGRSRVKKDPELLKRIVGGGGEGSVEKKVAEAFHKAFLDNVAELVKVNMEIMGDPYWIVDSGYGNYFANRPSEKSQITDDGTMNYESGDVYIYITFRTPVDISETTGKYTFPSEYTKESPFSGIYKVVSCENVFTDGTFKQKLECLRMRGQANEFIGISAEAKNQPTDKSTAPAVDTEGTQPTKSTPVDLKIPPKKNQQTSEA
jgi:hypothetical protein